MRPLWFSLVLVVVGCGASSPPDDPKTPITVGNEKDGTNPPVGSDDAKPSPTPGNEKGQTDAPPAGVNLACRLPAPVASDDACKQDADCAPSTPCHAHACVAASKATPRTPDIMCSMNIDCQSADANPCSCYQGRCALVPKNP